MRLDAFENRRKHADARADLIGQRRPAQGHTLPGVAFGLPVGRLMLAELLEQNHRQRARTSPADGPNMEWGRRLGNALAIAVREILTHVLDNRNCPIDAAFFLRGSTVNRRHYCRL
jgi:hypothetical protein